MRIHKLIRSLCLVIGRWLPAVLLLSALTGCTLFSTPSTVTPTATPPTPSPTPPPVTPTLPPLQPMVVTLKLWVPEELDPYGDGPGADVLAGQLAEFNRTHSDVQVEVTVKAVRGRGGMLDYLRTAEEAVPAFLPDLIVLNTTDLASPFSAGHIQPLDELVPESGPGEHFSFATAMGMVDEQMAGYVIGADMQHAVYREDQLDEPPVAWTQIITPPVSFTFPAAGRDGEINDATLIPYLAAGGKVTDSRGDPFLDKEVLVEALSFYSDCVSTGAISPALVLELDHVGQSWEQFQAGDGDMAVVQASQYWRGGASPEYAVASIPTRDGFPFSIVREAWAIALVAQDAERQESAMLLVDWLAAPERNGQWTQAAGYLPGTRSALRAWDVSSADGVALRGILEAAVPAPPSEVMAIVGPAMQTAAEQVLEGTASPEEAAAEAVGSLER